MRESQWIIERVVMKDMFWQQHSNISLNARQRKVINRLLESGDKFEGGMTTRKYVDMTRCNQVTQLPFLQITRKAPLGKEIYFIKSNS